MKSDYYKEPIVINTDALIPPSPSDDMWKNRKRAYYMYDAPDVPTCSIVVTGYNRLHKTKYCVECILKYTRDVDYELILVDNGSDDGTLDFFQSVPYENKTIIRMTQNKGATLPFKYYINILKGKYIVNISNDIYVTQNWLSNLLKCYQSDPKIGFVEPVSSNVSNLQEVDLGFSDFDDMQKKAAAFNQSDPAKWEERLRLISVINVFLRDVLDNVGINDAAYFYDFIEDDLCARIRRMGYKLVLCRDTWICHDHDFRNLEDKDPVAFQASLEHGRAVYRKKYYGIDPWDDINNFELTLLAQLDTAKIPRAVKALTVDVRCGAPALEIRNRLKRRGITDVASYAFTTAAKYYLDLQTVCSEVQCDRIDFIQQHYANGTFDLVVLGEPVNTYPLPVRLLQNLYDFLKPGGLLLFKVRNTDDYRAFLRSIGMEVASDPDLPASTPLNEVLACLKLFGAVDCTVAGELESISVADQEFLMNKLKAANPNADQATLNRLCIKDYCIKVIRK
ncbi:glycosyl transferase family 2 [Desulfitobacterium hafniense DCB-2]|uniref:Glycosyl transferase family 2 n=1 Tax=Desulfitobacterium hafniense (strain DSM 10664 / DCB-2) TaxID=272564 RepID=B8FTU6_DESHD|nr:glycosyltransferase [Desulfitobacterium hafniense]ACL22188.1 glycosyl transferase family 2 [Desulfitobacterium hafniense DCB-2]